MTLALLCCQTDCTVACAWSPDSRHFLTAATHPRLRTANGYRVYTYNGTGPVLSVAVAVLYQVAFKPAPAGTYADRPQSPGAKGPGLDTTTAVVSTVASAVIHMRMRTLRRRGAAAAAAAANL